MNRILLSIILLLAILDVAYAETKIFSGTVTTDTEKVIEGGVFKFRYDESANKVFVQTPSTNFIVDNGACKSNAVFRVCINRANFSYKDIVTYVYYYEVHADIYKLTGSLSATNKVNLATLLLGESANLEVTINNPTDFDVTNITFTQDLSPFAVSDVKGCTLNENFLEWKGMLKPKYDKVCTATITTVKSGAFTISGNLNYFNGYEAEKKTADPLLVTVLPRQLRTTKKIDSRIEIMQPFHINMSVQNLHATEDLDGYIRLELPPNLDLIENVAGFTGDFNMLERKILIEQDTSVNFSMYIMPIASGEGLIKEKIDYSIKNANDKFENYTYINVIDPLPVIDMISDYSNLTPSQKFIVVVKIKNPSIFYDFKKMIASLSVPYNNDVRQTLPKLVPNESATIISNTFILPAEIDSGKDRLKIELTFDYTLGNLARSVNSSIELKINQPIQSQTPVNEQQLISSTPVSEDTQTSQQNTQQETKALNESSVAKEPDVIQDVLSPEKLKGNLLDKKLWILVGSIFVIVLAAPLAVYLIRKRKKGNAQEPQQPPREPIN